MKIIDTIATGLTSAMGSTVTSNKGTTYNVSYDSTNNKITLTAVASSAKTINKLSGTTLSSDYIDVTCEVTQTAATDGTTKHYLTNIAYISEEYDKDGNEVTQDRDGNESSPSRFPTSTILSSSNADDYKGNSSNPSVYNDTNNTTYFQGQEDDDDFEKVVVMPKVFDLALRKFITKIGDTNITNRVPSITSSELAKLANGNATYDSGTTLQKTHPKDKLKVEIGDTVVYTIRVYNEGEVDGYATKVMDDIPDGLEYLPENEINKTNGWKMYVESDKAAEGSITYDKKIYVPTTDAKNADLIVTEALKDQLIKAYDTKTMETLDYKDVKVAFKVVEPNTSDRIIINYAQITEHKDTEGNTTVIDRDSTPNEWIEGEDDQDIEKIRLRYFDLALRKWVTEAIVTENGETQVTPTGHHAEDDPEAIVKVDLKKSKINNVTVKFRYSIRVTNEGEIAGYAKEVTDYIPAGLKFVSDDNQGWTTTENPNIVKTDLIADTLLQPGESAEVTIVLTWINDANNMGVKINTAEISKDYNEYGAKDIDSTPNNKVPGEDDIDDAPVMLSVKTGSAVIGYVTLAVAFLAIVGMGSYTIKRRII